MILGLVSNIIIVRKLSVNDFGIFSIVFMLIGLITTFGFSWSSSSILYYGSKEKTKYGSINKTFWARNIIIFLSLIISTILFALFRRQINDYIGINVSFLILIWLYISVAEDYLSQYFLAVKNQLLSGMLSITAKIIYLVLILFLSFDVRTLIILNIISHTTVLLYIFKLNKKDIGMFEFDKSWFREVLNFSLWQLFGFSGLYLINFGDTAVIKYFMTTEDVGIYNAAYKLFSNIASFSFVISSYYASNISQYFENYNYKKIKQFYHRERYYILLISVVTHIIVMIFSKSIIVTLYGDKYTQSVVIFNILMVGSMFSYSSVFYMLYYNTNKKYKIQQTLNLFQAILNVVLSVLLIKRLGLLGPAIATITSIVTTTIYSILYCEKRIQMNIQNMMKLESKTYKRVEIN
jgi:O-antigen/teichoic acid export membrane protein